MGMNEIESLLQKAEKLLYKDTEQELKKLNESTYPIIVNSEKYENAQRIYKQVLKKEPDNERAQAGLRICHDMLEPYCPVQHLAGASFDENSLLEKEENIQNKSESAKKMFPWDMRRKILDSFNKSDETGIKYTEQVFSEQRKEAEQKIKLIIYEAGEKVKTEEKDPYKICRKTIIKLAEYQQQLHQAWKGYGPEILQSASKELIKEIGIGEEIRKKIEKLKTHGIHIDNILSKTIGINEINSFVQIFSYVNFTLAHFTDWVGEVLDFYSSYVLKITVYSNGAYYIDSHFPLHPDNKDDDVYTEIKKYNNYRHINPEEFTDLVFLTWIMDEYF